ncbi:P34-Arc-domain-containing protein [Terfezia boudieri ATCC MYA-4762]|uniref:Arp2/3 complex 34 kDa subunit n=1 Tax=Terfezia boudieri ATCC MYA-4762 TaxID=1051890 RepID=A0A3N4LT51_9PEZI|nr:P34-Arc-domain-containing protein [Terfezia boudieri ATCC MYA-4762]
MLLLEYHNLLIQTLLTERFNSTTPTSIDQIISDFDGVTFHVSTPESKTKILVSISVKCFSDLVKYGANDVLRREYGPYVVEPEVGYDFSIVLDLENLPATQEEKDELIRKVALLRRNAMAAPFERAIDTHHSLSTEAAKFTAESAPETSNSEVMAIHYREEEAMYIQASHDRVTVVFSTVFREETDRIFGKVFLSEFVDARRRAIQNAPQVLYRNDPPLEIRNVPGVKTDESGDLGYITFVLFPRHLTRQRREESISHIQTFRDYFHYHIKAAKAYMHSRMRRRVADFLKVLNRAQPEQEEKEKKTVTGRTFTRAT